MLRNLVRLQLRPRFIRSFATTRQNNNKVCVIGAAGGIGQPLSLLLKVNPLVTDLALYDLKAATGVAMDISHIDTGGKVAGYCGIDNLKYALNCSQLVIIVAGVPRKPGMERSDLFKVNAKLVAEIMPIFAKVSPQAFLIIVTNPVNSLVPLAGEMLQKAGVFDPKRLFGASSLDVIRARTFTGEEGMVDPRKIQIDVVGGHSNLTILPLYSTLKPAIRNWDEENFEKLINRIQEAGAAVVAAKGTGSATLAIAYAVERFSNSLMMGLDGAGNIPVEYAFVFSNGNSDCEYFAHPLRLGKEGIKENLGIPPLSALESEMMKCLIPILNKDIEMGKEFAKKLPKKDER